MQRLLELFKIITTLPHCSKESRVLANYIESFAESCNYTVHVDQVGNILCYQNHDALVLQAHYDMVCIGKAPHIELIEEENRLSADNSTLGADNGIGVAMMLALMEEGAPVQCLFTADEEVGLIGANALAFDLKAKQLLNLDTEEEGHVFVGCAGGSDLYAKQVLKEQSCRDQNYVYRVTITGCVGGHSGVDIDKGIDNAIVSLAKVLDDHGVNLIRLQGGERINAIAKHAEAIVSTAQPLVIDHDNITVELLEVGSMCYKNSDQLLRFLATFNQGVRAYNFALDVPQTSINLATVSLDKGRLEVAFSARSMAKNDLETITQETKEILEALGFTVTTDGKYPPWEPTINDFTKKVADISKQHFNISEYKAIHAGLECAIIQDKYPFLEIASIGPNIFYPHSTREYVELDSVERVYNVVKEIIEA
jgi:dipeptidase D